MAPTKPAAATADDATAYNAQVRQANIMSMRRYYAKNRDKELQRFKEYYQKNKDKIRAYKKRAREQTKDTTVASAAPPRPTIADSFPLAPRTGSHTMDIGFLCATEKPPRQRPHAQHQSSAGAKMHLAFLLN